MSEAGLSFEFYNYACRLRIMRFDQTDQVGLWNGLERAHELEKSALQTASGFHGGGTVGTVEYQPAYEGFLWKDEDVLPIGLLPYYG